MTMIFDGETYQDDRDGNRLRAQMVRVYNLMHDAKWRTLPQISEATGDPLQSVSARLRDLRKQKFGGHCVERKYIEKGLFEYRLLVQRDKNKEAA